MYSCEIDQLLKKNNFNISNEEYKDILNPLDSSQIINVVYDTSSDSFRVATNDGYLWRFTVYK